MVKTKKLNVKIERELKKNTYTIVQIMILSLLVVVLHLTLFTHQLV